MQRVVMMMVLLLFLAGCGTAVAEDISLPAGDVARGAELFNASVGGAPTCATCHTLTDATVLGPGLLGFGAVAGSRVEGQSAEEYAYFSIARPSVHLVDGFANLMYTEYRFKLSEQEIADLIAYLLSL